MNKYVHIAVTVVLMAVVTRFVVRIVDATVQIDDDLAVLVLLLLIINAAIGFASYWLYRAGHH